MKLKTVVIVGNLVRYRRTKYFAILCFTPFCLAGAFDSSGQDLRIPPEIKNQAKPKKELVTIANESPVVIPVGGDPCKKHADNLAKLKLEAAGKVKETERVRLLDSDLGAMQQTALAEINIKIKNAELALARCEEKDREKKAAAQLKQQQEHELKLEQARHENQKELLAIQQEAARASTQPLPAEADFSASDAFINNFEAGIGLNQGFQKIISKDKEVQLEGYKQINNSVKQTKQAAPPKN